jgi:hypothetical protein
VLSLAPLEALPGGADGRGWCAPFAFGGDDAGDDVGATGWRESPNATCDVGAPVPPGATLAFGTCALPGASCTGATAVTLLDGASGGELRSVGGVSVAAAAALSSAAAGCVSGRSCSYGTWTNGGLAPVAARFAQRCRGTSFCAAALAWLLVDAPPPAPPLALPLALAFTLAADAATAANVTQLRGGAPPGAAAEVWAYVGAVGAAAANASAALASSEADWALLWNGTASGGGALNATLAPPLALPAGGGATLLVRLRGGGAGFPCAHSLGTPFASTLLRGDGLSVSQAARLASGALPSPAPLPASACAWSALRVTYASASTACAPPPAAPAAPPAPLIATAVPTTLATSLDDLLRALDNPLVTYIEVGASIALNGTQQLRIALPLGVGTTRSLLIAGTYACRAASAATPLCSIDGRGAARVISVQDGVSLRIAHLALVNGAPPLGEHGGCVLAQCSACSLSLHSVILRNCSAAAGGGGGVAFIGGGALAADDTLFVENSAALGGGLLCAGCALALNGTSFTGNVASAGSDDGTAARVFAPAGGDAATPLPLGPAGGGAALLNASGTLARCAFERNAATSIDVVLQPHPESHAARGGGALAAFSSLALTSTTLAANAAHFGGGLHVHAGALALRAGVLSANVASLGSGGGLWATAGAVVNLTGCAVAANAAGGNGGGGGIGASSAAVALADCVLSSNAAPDGCGGGAGGDAGSSLRVAAGSVVSNNTGYEGGGLCCSACAAVAVADALLHDNAATHGGGGALYTRAGTPAALSNSTLWGNSATDAGGALAAHASPLNVSDCALTGNWAHGTHGGAVYANAADDPDAGKLTLARTVLAGNACGAGGGAVAVFFAAEVAIIECEFSGNSIAAPAPAGGALMAMSVPSLTVRDSNFSQNRIAVVTPPSLLTSRSFVNGESACAAGGTGAGGALWAGSSDASAVELTRCAFHDNAAPSGGALYATGVVALRVRGSSFARNAATDAAAGAGGAISTDSAVSADVAASNFTSCEAHEGGAAHHGGASASAYDGCVFEGNRGDHGTAAHVTGGASLAVTASRFLRNRGDVLSEGTLHLAGSNASRLRVEHSAFDGNEAYLGGCIFVVRPPTRALCCCALPPRALAVPATRVACAVRFVRVLEFLNAAAASARARPCAERALSAGAAGRERLRLPRQPRAGGQRPVLRG